MKTPVNFFPVLLGLMTVLASAGIQARPILEKLPAPGVVPGNGALFGTSATAAGDMVIVSAPGLDQIFVYQTAASGEQVFIQNIPPAAEPNYRKAIPQLPHGRIVRTDFAERVSFDGRILATYAEYGLEVAGNPDLIVLPPAVQLYDLRDGQFVLRKQFITPTRINGGFTVSGDLLYTADFVASAAQVSAGIVNIYDLRGRRVVSLSPQDLTASSFFGASIGVSGSTVVIGAPGYFTFGANLVSGAAYVYRQTSPGLFVEQAQLLADSGDPTEQFGDSVAADGDRVLIGSTANGGTARLFQAGPNGFEEAASLSSPNPPENTYLARVAISGNVLALGAVSLDKPGRTTVFAARHGSDRFVPIQVLSLDGDPKGSSFGQTLALSPRTLVVGAPMTNAGTGAAYTLDVSVGR